MKLRDLFKSSTQRTIDDIRARGGTVHKLAVITGDRHVTKSESKEVFDLLMSLYQAGYSNGWTHGNRHKGTPKRVAEAHEQIKKLFRIKVVAS